MSRGSLLEFPGSDVADQRLVRFATTQTLVIVYLVLGAGIVALLSIESPRYWVAGVTFALGVSSFAAAWHLERRRAHGGARAAVTGALQRARMLLALSVVPLAAVSYLLFDWSDERALLSLWDVTGALFFWASLVVWMTAIARAERG